MAETAGLNFELEQKENQSFIRELVLQSINQVNDGRTKDFNEVCERLEKKYTSA